MKGADASEVNKLAADLRAAPGRHALQIRASMFKAGMNIKRRSVAIIIAAQGSGGGRTTMPVYPYSIDFDQEDDGFTIVAGPNKDREQGALGNLLEYGGEDFAPIPHLQPALDEEIPFTERALADIAKDLL